MFTNPREETRMSRQGTLLKQTSLILRTIGIHHRSSSVPQQLNVLAFGPRIRRTPHKKA